MACKTIELPIRTLQRWLKKGIVVDDRRLTAKRPVPVNKLSDDDVARLLKTCNREEYASLPPSQIVPRLADDNIYLASESTFYRVLKAHNQLHHRGRSQAPRKVKAPTSYTAEKPNQVWSWDITYLSSIVRGQYFYLYMVEDIYSRKIVGWEVYGSESGEQAAALMQRTVMAEQCFRTPLVLHSDNGSPMRSATLQAKLCELGVTPSHSRPRVSNDNPFSESLFRTLKYRPQWPSSGFSKLDDARRWVKDFVEWYNEEHRHSRIGFVTPGQRHRNEDAGILAKRKTVFEQAKAKHPERWSGEIRKCEPAGPVMLNPEKPDINEQMEQVA